MTAPGGDSGEKPQNEGEQAPSEGTYEAPPIEQSPARPGYEAPPTPPNTPGNADYETPPDFPAAGYPPPSYPPPNYPPPGYPPQSGYPPPNTSPTGYPAPGYAPQGYTDPSAYQAPQYGGSYPPPPPPQQYGPAPYAGGYGYGAAEPGTNTMAIASLVASVVGLLCGIGSIIGIVLGALALNQIKQTRQGGYGLAIAGIVVGIATLIISVIWAIYAWS